MNILSRDKQIEIIACLTEGMSIRSTERITGIHRDTIMRLGACVGKKQRQVTRKDGSVFGDQYTFIALASSARAIIAYHTGKRDSANTDLFVQDLRSRVLGVPEISTDGFLPYLPTIHAAD